MFRRILQISATLCFSFFIGMLFAKVQDITRWLKTDVIAHEILSPDAIDPPLVAMSLPTSVIPHVAEKLAEETPEVEKMPENKNVKNEKETDKKDKEPVKESTKELSKEPEKDKGKEIEKESSVDFQNHMKNLILPSLTDQTTTSSQAVVPENIPPASTPAPVIAAAIPEKTETPPIISTPPAPVVTQAPAPVSIPVPSIPAPTLPLHPILTDITLFKNFEDGLHPLITVLKNMLGVSSINSNEYFTKLTKHTIDLTSKVEEDTINIEKAIALINTTYGRTTENACTRVQYYSYLAYSSSCQLINEDICSSSAISTINHYSDIYACQRANGLISAESSREQRVFSEQQAEYIQKLMILDQKYAYLSAEWTQLVNLAKAAKTYDELGTAGNQINTFRIGKGKEITN